MNTHVLWVLVHSLAVLVFVNRYIAGVVLRVIRGSSWDEVRKDRYEPTVTVVAATRPMARIAIAREFARRSRSEVR